MNKITLQISLAPSDYLHAKHLLAHQLKVFLDQVDEVLLTYDTHRSKGHFATNWEQNNELMWNFLLETAKSDSKICLLKIDYGDQTRRNIGKMFFSGKKVPAKDWRGGPFYTYFYGIYAAAHLYVLHIDSDLFFGGLSQTWLAEAIDLYEEDSKILFINPLAGPPKTDGSLIDQNYEKIDGRPFHFRFEGMSTRIFLVNKDRLTSHPFTHIRTKNIGEMLRAFYKGNPAYLLPEEFMSVSMKKHGQYRLDFKGNEPGLWSLHPPYRTAAFYENLPETIQKIEQNEVPESQKGFYDIVDELVDWSVAKAKFRKL